jgi:O-antigen/teichoic acid export membrane protein
MAATQTSTTGKILHNSYWYGLETVIETVVFLGTSILVARYLGPEKLGYFSYTSYFVQTITQMSGASLASATRKYMSEFLALNKPGTARAVYNLAFRYQLIGSVLITLLGLIGVALLSDRAHRLMASILVIAIIPGIMSWVPAQANQAFEDVSKNTKSAFGYIVSYVIVILLTVHFHWDLVGIASATLVGRCVEVVLRTVPLNATLRKIPLEALGGDLIARIRKYCVEAIGIQLLMSIVWGRSEMVFLGAFCKPAEAGFYSIGCGLADKLLLVPRTFGSATGITLMVEASRDTKRVDSIVRNAARFLLLVVMPVHLGAVAITAQAVHFIYGAKYAPAIPVLVIASLLSIPIAFGVISETLMRTADRQRSLLKWYIITGAVNLLLDWFLIRRYGAVGAAWGNGLAQTFSIFAIWRQARQTYNFGFPIASAVRLSIAASIMAVLAWGIAHAVPNPVGLVAAIVCAAPTYVVLVRLLRGLEPSDRGRLTMVAEGFPSILRKAYLAAIDFATPGVSS